MKKSYLFKLLAVAFFASLLAGFALLKSQGVSKPATKQTLTPEQKEKLAKLSLPFIENKGQYPEDVRFYAKTFGGTVFVTKNGEIVYNLPKAEEGGVALKEKLIDSSPKAVKGEEPSEAKVSYFIGNDPSKWKTGLKTYNVVSLGEVYKGIELKLKAYGNNVEKLFYVKPGSGPDAILLKVEGGEGIEIAQTGELVVKTPLGDVRFTKPVAYQEIDGKRRQIDVAYVKLSKDEYGFKVGEYDKTKELIIDPLLASTFIGGSNDDSAYALTIDSSGNLYVTGQTWSNNYPTTPGSYDRDYNGVSDVFVSKLNSDLTSLLASTFIGGSGNDYAHALAIDSSGNVYVAGQTWSNNYPTTQEAYNESFNGGFSDVFVSKLNSNLTSLLASTFIGESYGEGASALAIDSSGNVYVAGRTESRNYPTTPGAYDTGHNGFGDVFVSKLDSNLSGDGSGGVRGH
jgi:hypothetical protein